MIRNQIKVLFIALLGVLLIKSTAGQIFSGGSANGYGVASSVPCAARVTLAVVGGSYSGASKSIATYTCTSVNLSMVGGSFNGYSVASSAPCAARTTLAVVGGSYSGASKGGATYTCTSVNLTMAGGSYNGYSSASSAPCTARTTLAMVGGFYSGASKGSATYTCTSVNLTMTGGSYNGYSAASSVPCAARTTLAVVGGSYSGASRGSSTYLCTSTNLVMIGGPFNGYSVANASACASRATLAVIGGSYSGSRSMTLACVAPASLTVSITKVDAACSQSDGSATAIISGGTSPYSYLWSPGNRTGATITGLGAGTYTVTVTEGGSFQKATASITITSTIGPSATLSATHISCNGGTNGTVTASASGGTPPYTYNWSNGATTSSINGLTIGTYTVSVGDVGTCVNTTSIIITEPAILTTSISLLTNNICNGGSSGSATVSVSGGTTPYSYLWNTSPVQTIATASNLAAGIYTVTVTDFRGCTSTVSAMITEPAALTAPISSHTNVSCNGGSNGSLTVNPSGGVIPYTYVWSTSPVQTTATAASIAVGVYTVTVKDANNCMATATATITQPAVLSVAASGNTPVCYGTNINLNSTPTGGTMTYSYSWSGPASYSSTDANPVIVSSTTAAGGTYFLTVTDAQGCTATASASIVVTICTTTLNLNLYIEGYYLGSGQMQPTVLNESVPTATGAETDTIYVLLHDTGNPAIVSDSVSTILMTDGTAMAVFNGTATGNSYWIAIKHRSIVETWSSSAVLFNPVTIYDFTTAATQAYGNNMIQVDFSPNLWAVYNGDINQDQNVDLLDFPDMDYGINNGLYGYYNTDLNGDGNVDLLDFPVLDANINNGIYSYHP